MGPWENRHNRLFQKLLIVKYIVALELQFAVRLYKQIGDALAVVAVSVLALPNA